MVSQFDFFLCGHCVQSEFDHFPGSSDEVRYLFNCWGDKPSSCDSFCGNQECMNTDPSWFLEQAQKKGYSDEDVTRAQVLSDYVESALEDARFTMASFDKLTPKYLTEELEELAPPRFAFAISTLLISAPEYREQALVEYLPHLQETRRVIHFMLHWLQDNDPRNSRAFFDACSDLIVTFLTSGRERVDDLRETVARLQNMEMLVPSPAGQVLPSLPTYQFDLHWRHEPELSEDLQLLQNAGDESRRLLSQPLNAQCYTYGEALLAHLKSAKCQQQPATAQIKRSKLVQPSSDRRDSWFLYLEKEERLFQFEQRLAAAKCGTKRKRSSSKNRRSLRISTPVSRPHKRARFADGIKSPAHKHIMASPLHQAMLVHMPAKGRVSKRYGGEWSKKCQVGWQGDWFTMTSSDAGLSCDFTRFA